MSVVNAILATHVQVSRFECAECGPIAFDGSFVNHLEDVLTRATGAKS